MQYVRPEKLRMAAKLLELGVDVIEAGFPIASTGDFEAVRSVCLDFSDARVAAFARCCRSDIEAAARAIEPCTRGRIHVCMSTSAVHLEHKLHKSQAQVLEEAVAMVGLACQYAEDVEFCAEDASRTDIGYLKKIAAAAVAAGARTVNIPDTVGYAIPEEHSDAKVLFVEDKYHILAEEALHDFKRDVTVIPASVDDLATEIEISADQRTPEPVSADDVALLMYTSGSVGRPKAAVHTHRTILAHGWNSIQAHQLASSDRSLLVLPLYHINAECVTLIPSLLSGGSVVMPRRFSVADFWDWLDVHRCTWSAVVPTIRPRLFHSCWIGMTLGPIAEVRSSSEFAFYHLHLHRCRQPSITSSCGNSTCC